MVMFFKKIPTAVKLAIFIITPLIAILVGFYFYGLQLRNAKQIYPNIKIESIDVSGLTRHDALQLLELTDLRRTVQIQR